MRMGIWYKTTRINLFHIVYRRPTYARIRAHVYAYSDARTDACSDARMDARTARTQTHANARAITCL